MTFHFLFPVAPRAPRGCYCTCNCKSFYVLGRQDLDRGDESVPRAVASVTRISTASGTDSVGASRNPILAPGHLDRLSDQRTDLFFVAERRLRLGRRFNAG